MDLALVCVSGVPGMLALAFASCRLPVSMLGDLGFISSTTKGLNEQNLYRLRMTVKWSESIRPDIRYL